jgi:hypothetical protein
MLFSELFEVLMGKSQVGVTVHRSGSDTLGKFKASRTRWRRNRRRTAIAKMSRRRNRTQR